jgi:hypothetical protein
MGNNGIIGKMGVTDIDRIGQKFLPKHTVSVTLYDLIQLISVHHNW